MFPIKPDHIRRVCFASKLYPKLSTTLGIETGNQSNDDGFDGEAFCGGRSTNRDLLAFFGLLSHTQRGASSFVQLPLFRRSVKKLTNLVEMELESIGAQEVLLPTLIPQDLWRKSKRLERQPDALSNVFHFVDKNDNKLLLGPTYEESITELVNDLDPRAEHELPLLLYQTSQKFRFEPNPRFGLLRSNEFLMNDMYSFDVDLTKAKETYALVSGAYDRIFDHLDLKCIKFESDPGEIGGDFSHEYQLIVASGEDILIKCNSCEYAYNLDMLEGEPGTDKHLLKDKCIRCYSTDIRQMQALELGHTFLLADTYSKPLKATIRTQNGEQKHYQMGCYGLGLSRILGAGLDLLSIVPKSGSHNAETENMVQMRWPSKVEPFAVGIVTPAKRSKQFQSGSSEFVERIVNYVLVRKSHETDMVIEDRDKDGIFKRLYKLQCLGIPNIIVVGQRFLHDPPQVELLTLREDKQAYEQHWLSEAQLCDYIDRNF